MIKFGPDGKRKQMLLTTAMGRIITSPVSTINYLFNTDYYQWMAQHETELKNLDNMNWWRAQKNEQERNMPSHPNRSPRHIPARILDIREDLMLTQLTYLFGEHEWKKNRYSNDRQCRHCGVHMQEVSEYIRKIVTTVDDLFSFQDNDKEDFESALQQALDFYDDKYSELIKDKARLNLPEYGQRTMFGNKYSWCPVCWEDIIYPQLGWDDRLE